MKAPAFAYVRAAALDEAYAALARHGSEAKVLAGGQSLLPALNMRLSSPALLVDINDVPGLDAIEVRADIVRLGALVRHRQLEDSREIAAHLPLASQAIVHVAHPAVRNRGTLGGSLALADPAAELPACALALDATIVAASSRGERRMRAQDFFVDLYETALAADELIVAVEIPRRATDERCAFIELARRHGDYATVGLAAVGRTAQGRWHDLTLAYLGAGRKPCVAEHAARVLTSEPYSPALLSQARRALDEDLDPMADLYTSVQTRRHLAGVLLARALAAMAAAPG